ncbi:hypothetical protein X740_05105 [Mesorhizobium sp. LNHC221B00]|nr:hypothetical protein X740_05105 [Mesorhizobium sp. LNHC221B00]ESZ57114.1 hypothetical protein X728_24635 [Mesorhizobium sp. L103C120A0]
MLVGTTTFDPKSDAFLKLYHGLMMYRRHPVSFLEG